MFFCSPLWLMASALLALSARTARAAADNATRRLLPLHDDKSISLSSRYSSGYGLNTCDHSPSSPAGHLFMTLRHESLLAENLDNLPRVRARLAERDPAVLWQLELLALQYHLQLAVDGDEGAVRAVVPQHELVLAPLDSAMLSRGLVIDDHELASLIAPKHERFAAAPPHDVLAPMHQAQPRLRRAQQRDGLGNVGDIGVLLPQQLEELDFLRLALYRHGVQVPRRAADDRGEQRHGIVRREDLPLHRLLVEAVREIDRVAENVVFALDHRPRLKADAQPELATPGGRKRFDIGLHPCRSRGGCVWGREERPYGVAPGLHHPPAVRLDRVAQHLHANRDLFHSPRVSGRLVQPGAARYIGEQDGRLTTRFHAPMLSPRRRLVEQQPVHPQLADGIREGAEFDRLSHVAVGADLVAPEHVFILARRGQHHHGNQFRPGIGAQLLQYLEAAQFRQFQIEENDRGHALEVAPCVLAPAEDELERLVTVARDDDFVRYFSLPQRAQGELLVIGVVLDDHDHFLGHCASFVFYSSTFSDRAAISDEAASVAHGRANRCPCASSQPCARRNRSCSFVSTPSASTLRPSE